MGTKTNFMKKKIRNVIDGNFKWYYSQTTQKNILKSGVRRVSFLETVREGGGDIARLSIFNFKGHVDNVITQVCILSRLTNNRT